MNESSSPFPSKPIKAQPTIKMIIGRLLSPLTLCAFITGCGDSYLRGSAEPSTDGKTYLAVVDDNGGGCGPIKVDGKIWRHPIGQPGVISPGVHTIECGGKIEFDIPAGVIFMFDYWGP